MEGRHELEVRLTKSEGNRLRQGQPGKPWGACDVAQGCLQVRKAGRCLTLAPGRFQQLEGDCQGADLRQHAQGGYRLQGPDADHAAE